MILNNSLFWSRRSEKAVDDLVAIDWSLTIGAIVLLDSSCFISSLMRIR
jgi:hypothetical protein